MELLLRREEYSSSAEFLPLVSCSWTVLGNPCALDTTLEQAARIWSLRPRTMERVCHSSCCVMERQSRQVVAISIFNIKTFVFLNQVQCCGCGGCPLYVLMTLRWGFSCPHASGFEMLHLYYTNSACDNNLDPRFNIYLYSWVMVLIGI